MSGAFEAVPRPALIYSVELPTPPVLRALGIMKFLVRTMFTSEIFPLFARDRDLHHLRSRSETITIFINVLREDIN